jgi:hypothetical protein
MKPLTGKLLICIALALCGVEAQAQSQPVGAETPMYIAR